MSDSLNEKFSIPTNNTEMYKEWLEMFDSTPKDARMYLEEMAIGIGIIDNLILYLKHTTDTVPDYMQDLELNMINKGWKTKLAHLKGGKRFPGDGYMKSFKTFIFDFELTSDLYSTKEAYESLPPRAKDIFKFLVIEFGKILDQNYPITKDDLKKILEKIQTNF